MRERVLRFIRAMVIGGDASDLAELRRAERERTRRMEGRSSAGAAGDAADAGTGAGGAPERRDGRRTGTEKTPEHKKRPNG